MSAVAGIIRLDSSPLSPNSIQSMIDTLTHRGPHGVGVWQHGQVGLGHRMLWTTPESLYEKLPLESASNVITADARIDNRDELFPYFDFGGRPAREISDSEIILAAYEKWGESCVKRLLGDFVFAIWDKKAQKLICARDHFGVKPLYYFQSNRIFAFATEIKALLCLPEIPRKINELRIAYYLIDATEDTEITFYQNIFRLPAAHTLSIQNNDANKNIRRYWSLDPADIRMKSDEAYAESFRNIFTEAITARSRSAFPVGSFLSGGLDSSSISCVAQKILDKEHSSLHTYSAIFPNIPPEVLPYIDERKYVDAVLKSGNFTRHFINADSISPLSGLKETLGQLDEAFYNANIHIHAAIYHAASLNGLRILMDGIDGDSVVSHGWEHFSELLRTGRLGRLFQEVTAYRKNTNLNFSRSKFIWEHAVIPLIPAHYVNFWKNLNRPKNRWEEYPIQRDFAARIHLLERLRNIEQKQVYTARERHMQKIISPLYPYFFEIADKVSAAFSIEARYPFFDLRLVEFCIAIPPSQKMGEGWNRVVMRRAMQDILPPVVQWRPDKSNLGVNWRRAMNAYEQPTFHQMLQDDLDLVKDYIDVSALKKAFRQNGTGSSEHRIREEDLLNLSKTLILNTWLKVSQIE